MLRYVSVTRKGPVLEIVRDQVREDGTLERFAHQIPVDCLSIRAGEYGLDPIDDAEAVLDMLLHELDSDANPADEILPPITTAATLEEARDIQLERCRKARDGRHRRPALRGKTSPAEDMTHVEVLESLPGLFIQDRQLAELSRIHMKSAVWAERERQARPTFSRKSVMLDEIREREGV